MSSVAATPVHTAGLRTGMHRRTLPSWGVPALLLAAALLTAGLFAVTELQGVAGFVLVTALVFVVAQTAVSAQVEGGRRARDRLVTTFVVTAFTLAVIPLASVLLYTAQQGLGRFDGEFFTHSLRNIGARDLGGGAYHAILGTLEQVGIATLISVPFGLLVAVYVVEYGRGRLASTIRFFVDVMTGIPSIVAGLFILSFWVIGLGRSFSGLAASMALTVLMLPTIVRSAEEMLRLVPDSLREASYALGVARWRTILKVVVPTALPGIVTGIMLAVARVMGETAPVLLTAGVTASINADPTKGPQANLPTFVFLQAGDPQQGAVDRAWTGALTLILIVMTLNLLALLLTRRNRLKR